MNYNCNIKHNWLLFKARHLEWRKWWPDKKIEEEEWELPISFEGDCITIGQNED